MTPAPRSQTFGPAELCQAIGIPRALFDGWLSRRYIEAESLGAGRARKFTFDEAMHVAALAALAQRMPISQAAAHLNAVADRFRAAVQDDFGRDRFLLIGEDAQVVRGDYAEKAIRYVERVPTLVVMNINRLVENTYKALLVAAAPQKGRPPKRTVAPLSETASPQKGRVVMAEATIPGVSTAQTTVRRKAPQKALA